jgi:hypothetical protein
VRKIKELSGGLVQTTEESASFGLTAIPDEDLALAVGGLEEDGGFKCAIVGDDGKVYTHNSYPVTA